MKTAATTKLCRNAKGVLKKLQHQICEIDRLIERYAVLHGEPLPKPAPASHPRRHQ